jgi:DNA-binding HxlR family transcriptional regulator
MQTSALERLANRFLDLDARGVTKSNYGVTKNNYYLISARRGAGISDACGTALAMDLVGERWALLIVRELLLGPRRFGEIRGALEGLSANILTQRLEGLEKAGILRRRNCRRPPTRRSMS